MRARCRWRRLLSETCTSPRRRLRRMTQRRARARGRRRGGRGRRRGSSSTGARPPSRPGLSPSRANDFLQCPQLFRFRVIDRLPEPPSPAAARGHARARGAGAPVRPARPRAHGRGRARRCCPVQWEMLLERDPSIGELFAEPADAGRVADERRGAAGDVLHARGPDAARAARARADGVHRADEDGPQLRGIVDRVDVAPNGWVRVVDYKTGRSPRAGFESSALFQMRFYAYVIWRTRGVLPKRLQLEYLGDGVILQHEPTESEMATIEARVRSIWGGIEDAARSGDWRPRPSKLCDWCSFKALCPAFGGTPPEVPAGAVERSIGVVPAAPDVDRRADRRQPATRRSSTSPVGDPQQVRQRHVRERRDPAQARPRRDRAGAPRPRRVRAPEASAEAMPDARVLDGDARARSSTPRRCGGQQVRLRVGLRRGSPRRR